MKSDRFFCRAGEWIAPLSSAPWTCSTRRPRSRSGRSHSPTTADVDRAVSFALRPRSVPGAAGVRRVVALRGPADLDTVLSGTRAGLGETGRRQRDVTQSDRRRKRPTMKDVAEHARVSASTVSHVLDDSGPAAPERRDRVLDAVQVLEHSPNEPARPGRGELCSLKNRVHPTLSVVAWRVGGSAARVPARAGRDRPSRGGSFERPAGVAACRDCPKSARFRQGRNVTIV